MSAIADRLTAALGRSHRIARELGAGGMATVYLACNRKREDPGFGSVSCCKACHCMNIFK